MVDTERGGSLGTTGIAVAFGLAVMVTVYAIGHVSGAHINPAVTIAFAASRHFSAREVVAYVPSQLAGAIAAALVLRLAWEGTPAALGATVPSLDTVPAFLYEVVLTAFLMFVIMAVATDTRAVGAAAAIAIGGTVALAALVGGDVTGASLNPARSFGPALVAAEWDDFWVYVAGPIAGAVAGVVLYGLVRGPRDR